MKKYTESQLKETAMLEVAYEILKGSKDHYDYHSLLKEVGEIKGMSEAAMTKRIANLYTEMTVDGRFVNIGENRWGLRSWYPFDQTEEELSQANKTRKKKRREEEEEEDDLFSDDDEDDFDEFEDLEDELDELANEEDDDEEEFDKDDDEDLDEDDDELKVDEDLDK